MQGIGVVLSAIAATGCGFELTAGASSGAADSGTDVVVADASSTEIDAALPDAAPIERKLYAASDTTLYRIDVDAKVAAVVGTMQDSAGTYDVDGLAFDGTNVLGISANGVELLTIHPDTAAVTARRAISPIASYGGLTVAPAGEAGQTAVVFAGSGNKLVRIDATTGAATTIGTFGGGMNFFSDLAWVNGVGLFVTLMNGTCATRCFARVNPTTGTATVFRNDFSGDYYGLSGYRGSLWTFHHDGPVLQVNQTNGLMTTAFNPGIAWTEAAQ